MSRPKTVAAITALRAHRQRAANERRQARLNQVRRSLMCAACGWRIVDQFPELRITQRVCRNCPPDRARLSYQPLDDVEATG